MAGATCIQYRDINGTWNMKVLDIEYDWKLVAELLNDLFAEYLKCDQ
jgi:hypothetical protein